MIHHLHEAVSASLGSAVGLIVADTGAHTAEAALTGAAVAGTVWASLRLFARFERTYNRAKDEQLESLRRDLADERKARRDLQTEVAQLHDEVAQLRALVIHLGGAL